MNCPSQKSTVPYGNQVYKSLIFVALDLTTWAITGRWIHDWIHETEGR